MIVDIDIIRNAVIVIIKVTVISLTISIKVNPFRGIAWEFVERVAVGVTVIIKVYNITKPIAVEV